MSRHQNGDTGLTRAGEVKALRLRILIKQADKVKSRYELVSFAMGKFMVSKRTAEDYVEEIIEYYKQHPELLK